VSDDRVILDFAAALKRLDRIIAELALTKGMSIISAIALDSPTFEEHRSATASLYNTAKLTQWSISTTKPSRMPMSALPSSPCHNSTGQ